MNILIDAVIAAYGMTITEAKKFAKHIDENMKQELINGYLQDSKKAFYND